MSKKRELMLLRHGKANGGDGGDDYHRILTARGIRDAQHIGVWLEQQDMIPDLIIASPAERAADTAQKVSKVMGMAEREVRHDHRIYAADLDALLEVVDALPESDSRILLIGHNPGLEQLLGWLSRKEVSKLDDRKHLPTAALAIVRIAESWCDLTKGCGKLKSITRPDSLPREFPYPGADGKEWRLRPEYYYNQSAVIPYRKHESKLEVLIISSRNGSHLVVPKGIKEPELSLQESAAKEALEEAGVEGDVVEEALGSYKYEKWGSDCSVTVYPMKVTHLVPEEEWEERHRGRQWMSPNEAIKKLNQKELGKLVKILAAQYS